MGNFSIDSISALDKGIGTTKATKTFGSDFSNLLKNNIDETNRLLNKSDSVVTEFSVNKSMDLHEVMIAVEEASMALTYTMQVKNKIIEAYQEVMRTQI